MNGEESFGEDLEENETDPTEIFDWHDLNDVRDDLDGDYILMKTLDENTEGYDYYNTEPEDYKIEKDAGYGETWGEGDRIDIIFDEDEYDSVLSVENETGAAINHTVGEDTITIEENTGEQYIYLTYKNAVVGWSPIGDYNDEFTGSLNGNGQEIRDLYINRPSEGYVGLFGNIVNGVITDLRVVDAEVTGSGMVGVISGRTWGYNGKLENSYATGNVIGKRNNVGGLIGMNRNSIVSNSFTTVDVSGEGWVGAVVGFNDGTVENSYATGNVWGEWYLGGLVGRNSGTVVNSYAIGLVARGERLVGGLVGSNYDGSVSNSFWDIETSGQNESNGGSGKTTAEMKNVATYTDTDTEGLDEPWDFVGDPNDDDGDEDIWGLDEEINDGYPFLTWAVSELTIEIKGEGSVDIDPDQDRYIKGTTLNLTADPDGGWEFVEWTDDYEGTEEQITITMDEDKEITAVFEKEEDESILDRIRDIPGFTSIVLLLAMVIAVAIHQKTYNEVSE